jgi:hypothetical protein
MGAAVSSAWSTVKTTYKSAVFMPWSFGLAIPGNKRARTDRYCSIAPTTFSGVLWVFELILVVLSFLCSHFLYSDSQNWTGVNTDDPAAAKTNFKDHALYLYIALIARALVVLTAVAMNIAAFVSRDAMFALSNGLRGSAGQIGGTIVELGTWGFAVLAFAIVYFADGLSQAADHSCSILGKACDADCWQEGMIFTEHDGLHGGVDSGLKHNILQLFYYSAIFFAVAGVTRWLRNFIVLLFVRLDNTTTPGDKGISLATNPNKDEIDAMNYTPSVETTYGLSGLRRVDLNFT